MCDCLNDVVEIAVCVRADALSDAEASQALQSVAAWAGHDQRVDVALARSAPVHYAIALLNVPRGGPTAHWLVAELVQILQTEDQCGLHPAWRAYGGIWLAHMAAASVWTPANQSDGDRALAAAREHVDAAGGICPGALYSPPTVAELDDDPYAWLTCEDEPASVPEAAGLVTNALAIEPAPELAEVSPLVLGLRTLTTDDWRTWSTATLVHRLHARPDGCRQTFGGTSVV